MYKEVVKMKKILALALTTLLTLSAFSVGLETFALRVVATEGYTCKANYYLMNKDMSTYFLDKTETEIIAPDQEYAPQVYDYEGFISPKQKTVTASADKTVNYFYERETYTIDYVTPESNDTPESQIKIYGIDTKVTKIKPERKGYTFAGWSNSEDSQEIAYQSGDIIEYEGNLTLYAVWKINTYIVSFDSNGGALCEALAYEYGDTYGELPVSEKSGYSFGGWYYDSELNTPVSDDDTVDASGDRIFYAKWIERNITSLTIASLPEKTDYFVGDNIITTGLTLSASYDNGETEVVTSGYTTECAELKDVGDYEVAVSYEGLSCTYNINVSAVELIALEIKKLPQTVAYYVDDSLDTSGMVAEIKYNNGKSRVINDYIAEYDFSVAGEAMVTVIYTEYGITVSDSFDVTVIEKPIVYSEDVTAEKGQTIAVPVYIKDNSGLMGYHIKLSFDSDVLSPISTEASDIFAAGMYNDSVGVDNTGVLSVAWTGTKAVVEDGLMFTAYFKVQDVVSGDYEIEVSYEEADTIAENYSEVKLACINYKVTVSNDNYIAVPMLYADDVSADAGGAIQLPIYVKNGEALDRIGVVISYDENIMKPLSVTANSGNVSFVSDGSTVFISIENVEISTSDEQLVLVDFEVSETACGSYDVSISADCATPDTIVIDVASEEATLSAKLYADEISFGENLITVPVYIGENSGIMGYKINVLFDSTVLTLMSVSCGNDYMGGMFNYSITDGVVSVVWNNAQNISGTGVLFTLTFEKIDDAVLETIISLDYSQDDTFNENWDSVALDCSDIEIPLTNVSNICGDVNTDELVDLKDVILLKRYLAGGYEVSVNKNNADINKDDSVNVIDIMILERYLNSSFENVNKWFE